MAKQYNTPPQTHYEAKPIGGILTMRQAAYIAAGAAIGLLLSLPIRMGLTIHGLIIKSVFVLIPGGLAAFFAMYRVGDMPLDQYMMLLYRRSTSVSRYPWSRDKAKTTAQIFLGIEDIRKGIIKRTDGIWCLVMEVGAINYFLLSEAEQDMVDAAVARLLRSLNRPLTEHVQARYLDAGEVLVHYREAGDKTLEGPLGEYTRHLMKHMENELRYNGVMVRRSYFVFESREKTLESAEEDMLRRAQELAAHLHRIRRIPARALDTDKVADLVYVANNKDRSRLCRASNAAELGYFDLMVEGRRPNDLVQEA